MSPSVKNSVPLIVRCFAESKGDVWQAFTLEFGLAVQGDSFDDVQRRLCSMLEDYLFDALAGTDREHANSLLTRRAPFWVFYRFHRAMLLHLMKLQLQTIRTFLQPVPLEPVRCP